MAQQQREELEAEQQQGEARRALSSVPLPHSRQPSAKQHEYWFQSQPCAWLPVSEKGRAGAGKERDEQVRLDLGESLDTADCGWPGLSRGARIKIHAL